MKDKRLLNITASFFIILSIVLMLLPVNGAVSSFRNLLSYIFIPQVKTSNYTYDYSSGIAVKVRDLINSHKENEMLKEEMKNLIIMKSQMQDIRDENERLTKIFDVKNKNKWNGVWARAAYKEPSRWNTVIIDKGEQDGIKKNSAVLGINQEEMGLVGKVLEVNKDSSKVLLITDKDFSAACYIGTENLHGLLTGTDGIYLQVKYIPINAEIEKNEQVFTSNLSAVFPRGIKIGEVSEVQSGGEFNTFLTLEINPFVNISSLKEVFVITKN